MRSAAARIGTHEGMACRRSTNPSRRAQRDPGRDLLPVWFCTPRGADARFEFGAGCAGVCGRRYELPNRVAALLDDECPPVRFPCAGVPGELRGDLPVLARTDLERCDVPFRPHRGLCDHESSGFPSPRISRPGGGIGRRGRLKIGRPHGRVGSSPTPGITSMAPSAVRASRADNASQAAPIPLIERQAEGKKAAYKTASAKARRGQSSRARWGKVSTEFRGLEANEACPCVSRASGVRRARLTRAGALSNKPGAGSASLCEEHAPAPNETKGI
jgi:hypothetical protein